MVAVQNATAQFLVAGKILVDKTTYVKPFKQDFKNAKVACIFMQVYDK